MLSNRFRWVFCQLEVLRHCFPANLRRALEELPKSLDETYKRILNEINNANREHAYRLLQCLTVALRPLRVEELAEVLAFDLTTSGVPKLNADWRWEDKEEAVLSACSSLVTVIIEDGSRVVQFSHFSVKEFLTSNRLASFMEEVSQFHIPIEPSHVILAQACLGVLLCLDNRTDEDGCRTIPLCRYAAKYWVEHAQFGNVESQLEDAMDRFFDMDNPHFSAWVRIFEYADDLLRLSDDEEPTGVPRPAASLYFAAWKGFRSLVERLILKDSQQVNDLGGFYGTPLHASVLGGHIDLAQFLITHGANVNSRCGDNYTPLHVASFKGHLKIGKWLLNNGAEVNSKEKRGETPLHFAAKNGHVEVCRILLERNAEVNSRNNDGFTPFLLALERNNPDVAWLLLDHNADVHADDNIGNTPLQFAARNGLLQVTRKLLEHNAEVNSRNHHGSTPLLLASQLGRANVVRLLLDHNADAYARDDDGDTPLHCAARGGQIEVAQILLKLNVEVNSRNNEGSTPLHQAVLGWEEGSAGLVRLLLDYGADALACNLRGENAFEVARGSEQQEIIRLLSQHAAERTNETGCRVYV